MLKITDLYPTLPNPFPTIYEQFIYVSRYSRWLPEEGRREQWKETVVRLVEYYKKVANINHGVAVELYTAIHNLEVMPSMRSLMTAGETLDRCNVPAYNCAYAPVDNIRVFDETMYILMCGTGMGYSVEEKYVSQLPAFPSEFRNDGFIIVEDSKEGWADALRLTFNCLLSGRIPEWDVSRVRPAGARLKTFGGRASGPQPLLDLFDFLVTVVKGAAGRRLSTLEVHDIMCKIADIVVVGGVRRSAMISLFDCTDVRMAKSKTGNWWESTPHRRLANNSGTYNNRRPDAGFFMDRWKELYDSKAGEPGFFSRYACQNIAGRSGRRDASFDFGTNPCSEIILRPFQFCNLTEVVVRSTDTFETLKRKARVAAILGTIQSSLTDFNYLRPIWKETCEEERLLGVSLTGICDNLALLDETVLSSLKQVVIDTNKEWATVFGINQSTATTCVKPSGTVSQLVDSASGMHTRHSPFYLRTVRGDNKDPLSTFLKEAGVYWEPDYLSPETTSVFYFPMKSPDGCLTRNDETAIDALTRWKLLQDNWCEHKPSATVYIKDDEWLEVSAWVYENFDSLSGVAFLPYDGGTYKQAPYQELTEEEFNKWVEDHPMPSLDFSDLRFYEFEDATTGSQELACSAGGCDITSFGG